MPYDNKMLDFENIKICNLVKWKQHNFCCQVLLSYSLWISVNYIWITPRDLFLRWVIPSCKKKASHTDIHTLWLKRMHNLSSADAGLLGDESQRLALTRQSQQNNPRRFQRAHHVNVKWLGEHHQWGCSITVLPVEFALQAVNTPSHACSLT